MHEKELEIPAFLKRSSIEDLTPKQKELFEKEREERQNVKSISDKPLVEPIVVQEQPQKEKVVKQKPKGQASEKECKKPFL